MERCEERFRKESIKNTVLKHEKIFKQQVQELHRLYEVQKKLMRDVRTKELGIGCATDSKNKLWNSKSSSETSRCSHATVLNHSTDVPNSESTSIHRFCAAENPHELSNSLGQPLKISREYNFHEPFEGESQETCSNLDLTLSIGCATDMNKTDWKQKANDSSLVIRSNLNRPDGIQQYTSSAGGFGSERMKSPHWLFLSLSLNRT